LNNNEHNNNDKTNDGVKKRRIKRKEATYTATKFKIDFSFKREVFFIIAGALAGAIVYVIPITVFAIGQGSLYYLTWIVFGHIAGVYSPISAVIISGFMLHVLVATSIGIMSGLFLYKTNILNISKPSNGLKYGLFVGSLVFVLFAIPVQEFVLGPEFARTIDSGSATTAGGTSAQTPMGLDVSQPMISQPSATSPSPSPTTDQSIFIQFRALLNSLIINLIFGITLGLFSSLLSIKFGARYRCPKCDISFSRVDSLQCHLELVHGAKTIHPTKILILGGGFAGVEVLRRLQDRFQNDVSIDITMVSKDNFLLFTPMLHEVASGMVETRHIVTPIRAFCKRAKFYASKVKSIDLNNRQIQIEYPLSILSVDTANTNSSNIRNPPTAVRDREPVRESDRLLLSDVRKTQPDKLPYDYLVIALGSETRFFGIADIEKHALTIKNWTDAIVIRNHVIHQLEVAELLLRQERHFSLDDEIKDSHSIEDRKEDPLTFVVVGGGFAGVETAGELNDFLRDAVNDYYHNIEPEDIRVIILQSGNRLLPEMSEELSEFAMQKLTESGVKVLLNTRVTGATATSVQLKDGKSIPTNTIIWSGGIAPNPIIENLTCEHDKRSGRVLVNKYLEVERYPGVFALGDCAYMIDPNTGNPYPPTAQHAIREGTVVAKNIISLIERKPKNKKAFDYKTKGMMASIGKRNGVGEILGLEVQGFLAWWIWRMYYLANLPTLQKKLRVMADWTLDIFFKRDVTMLKTFLEGGRDADSNGTDKI
jgi:NADH dehydrogenase FAD-containing subunit